MPILEKTCQDYILHPTIERIKLNELPIDTVVKSVGISQEPSRKLTVDHTVKPGKLYYLININISYIYIISN